MMQVWENKTRHALSCFCSCPNNPSSKLLEECDAIKEVKFNDLLLNAKFPHFL